MRRQPDANQHPSRRQDRAIKINNIINNQFVNNTSYWKLTPLNVRVYLNLGEALDNAK
jgi:hypothetical protein